VVGSLEGRSGGGCGGGEKRVGSHSQCTVALRLRLAYGLRLLCTPTPSPPCILEMRGVPGGWSPALGLNWDRKGRDV
jgi:hypothetical protein